MDIKMVDSLKYIKGACVRHNGNCQECELRVPWDSTKCYVNTMIPRDWLFCGPNTLPSVFAIPVQPVYTVTGDSSGTDGGDTNSTDTGSVTDFEVGEGTEISTEA